MHGQAGARAGPCRIRLPTPGDGLKIIHSMILVEQKWPAMFERFKHLFTAPDDSGADSAAPAPFDYDDVILLDAEDLAEQGILEAYEQLHPQLRQYDAEPADIVEEFDEDAATYTVFADGRRYDIRGNGVEGDAWALATVALFEIVNASLAGSDHGFYALYGGNDLAGIFLTDEQFQLARESIARHTHWPWIPVNHAPDYGFPFDEEQAG